MNTDKNNQDSNTNTKEKLKLKFKKNITSNNNNVNKTSSQSTTKWNTTVLANKTTQKSEYTPIQTIQDVIELNKKQENKSLHIIPLQNPDTFVQTARVRLAIQKKDEVSPSNNNTKEGNDNIDSFNNSNINILQSLNDQPPLYDEPNIDDYDTIPVEEFGFAMLRGMGWSEGHGVGLTNRKVVEPTSVKNENLGRIGLGASPNIHNLKLDLGLHTNSNKSSDKVISSPVSDDKDKSTLDSDEIIASLADNAKLFINDAP